MIVVVTGSRTWTDVEKIRQRFSELPKDTILYHGGAIGADSLADLEARLFGLDVRVRHADWNRHGRSAGAIRNRTMLTEAQPDLVLAFWDGDSRGTRHMIGLAEERGIPLEIISP